MISGVTPGSTASATMSSDQAADEVGPGGEDGRRQDAHHRARDHRAEAVDQVADDDAERAEALHHVEAAGGELGPVEQQQPGDADADRGELAAVHALLAEQARRTTAGRSGSAPRTARRRGRSSRGAGRRA
jgi:hypothetical protein